MTEHAPDPIRDTFRSSLSGWLYGTSAGIFTVLLALGGIVATVGAAGDWGGWPLLATVLALMIVASKWIETLSARYDLTAERLIVRRGVFMKSIDEVELYRVKDVRMNFSLLNQMARIGTICLVSSDETTRAGNLVIREVPQAEQRREELRRLVDAARRRRGVREFDMVSEGQ
jgi:uncharacterized membrane protein YdbT with pleckstrin-like domain